jgi:DNA-binding NarL/FixJ family response regulator
MTAGSLTRTLEADEPNNGTERISNKKRRVMMKTTVYALNPDLTQREREILSLVALGQSDRTIAERLTISTRTVNRHMSNILLKFAVLGRTAAVIYAMRRGLL